MASLGVGVCILSRNNKKPLRGVKLGTEGGGAREMLNIHQHIFLQVQKSLLGVQSRRNKAGNRSQ